MNFCSNCGAKVTFALPEGDTQMRHICTQCHRIHYQNPKIITGCIAHLEGKILLCRRAIAPGYGRWSIPAGYLENEETTQQGALRECSEEAGAQMSIKNLYTVINMPDIQEVYLLYRAELTSLHLKAGPESLEVGLFSEDELPWEELAFHQLTPILKAFYNDQRVASYPTRNLDIESKPMARTIPTMINNSSVSQLVS